MIYYNGDRATLTVYDAITGEYFTIDATCYIRGTDYKDLMDLLGAELAATVRDCWNSSSEFPEDLERVSGALDGTRYAARVDGVSILFM